MQRRVTSRYLSSTEQVGLWPPLTGSCQATFLKHLFYQSSYRSVWRLGNTALAGHCLRPTSKLSILSLALRSQRKAELRSNHSRKGRRTVAELADVRCLGCLLYLWQGVGDEGAGGGGGLGEKFGGLLHRTARPQNLKTQDRIPASVCVDSISFLSCFSAAVPGSCQ